MHTSTGVWIAYTGYIGSQAAGTRPVFVCCLRQPLARLRVLPVCPPRCSPSLARAPAYIACRAGTGTALLFGSWPKGVLPSVLAVGGGGLTVAMGIRHLLSAPPSSSSCDCSFTGPHSHALLFLPPGFSCTDLSLLLTAPLLACPVLLRVKCRRQ